MRTVIGALEDPSPRNHDQFETDEVSQGLKMTPPTYATRVTRCADFAEFACVVSLCIASASGVGGL